jgi:ubiquinone/menaquinone biosynthesis C-methylase UbiE
MSLVAPDRSRLLAELMDDPALGLDETERALADLDRVTFWSGGLLPIRRALLPLLTAGPRHQRLLDLGTGSGLAAARLAATATGKGVHLLVVGCDRKLSHLLYGRRQGHRQIRVVARAEQLPFADDAFDWSLSTLLLHHFDEATNRAVLFEMRRVARRAAAIIDLRRSRLASWLFRPLARALGMGRVARYDGLVSLAQAWSRTEVARLAADLPLRELCRRLPFRLSLVIDCDEPGRHPDGEGSQGRAR